LATRVCGSCFGLASELAVTASPPISRASEASTLSDVTTRTLRGLACAAGDAAVVASSVAMRVVISVLCMV